MNFHEFSPEPYGALMKNGMPSCADCGKMQYHEEHYNGDRSRAATAFKSHQERMQELAAVKTGDLAAVKAEIHEIHLREVQDLEQWRRALRTGVRIQVSHDHPSGDYFAGRLGTVRDQRHTKRAAYVNLDERIDRFGVPQGAWSGIVEWVQLQPVSIQVPVFQSQDEADEWLALTAKDMGIEEPRPQFASVEEAEAWLDEQAAKEAAKDRDHVDRMTILLSDAIAPAQTMTMSTGLTEEAMHRAAEQMSKPVYSGFEEPTFSKQTMAMRAEYLMSMGVVKPEALLKGMSVD